MRASIVIPAKAGIQLERRPARHNGFENPAGFSKQLGSGLRRSAFVRRSIRRIRFSFLKICAKADGRLAGMTITFLFLVLIAALLTSCGVRRRLTLPEDQAAVPAQQQSM